MNYDLIKRHSSLPHGDVKKVRNKFERSDSVMVVFVAPPGLFARSRLVFYKQLRLQNQQSFIHEHKYQIDNPIKPIVKGATKSNSIVAK